MKAEIHFNINEFEILVFQNNKWESLMYKKENNIELKQEIGKRLGYELFDLIYKK